MTKADAIALREIYDILSSGRIKLAHDMLAKYLNVEPDVDQPLPFNLRK